MAVEGDLRPPVPIEEIRELIEGVDAYPSALGRLGEMKTEMMAASEFNGDEEEDVWRGLPTGISGHEGLADHQLSNALRMAPGRGRNGVLLVHGTGSGKTRTALAICEQYVDVSSGPAMIICPRPIRRQFREELSVVNHAVYRGKWIPRNTDAISSGVRNRYWKIADELRSSDRKDLAIAMDEAIAVNYTFSGYESFGTQVESVTDRVAQVFSNRVIVVDESHNMRSIGSGKSKNIGIALSLIAQKCINTKIVLMTATPMYDHAHEILEPINALRLNDGLPEIPNESVFPKGDGLEEGILRQSIRRYVSKYSREVVDESYPQLLDPLSAKIPGIRTAWPAEPGTDNPPSSASSIIQLMATADQEEVFDRVQGSGTLLSEATNVVFPGKGVGQAGFESAFDVERGEYIGSIPSSLFGSDVHKISPKIHSIVSSAIKAEGLVLITSRFAYAGAYPVAIALEERGYRPFFPRSGFLTDAKSRTSGPAYALVDGTTERASEIDRVMEAFRAPSNVNGDDLKVVVCTGVLSEGSDFANVRQLHIMEGWWNVSSYEQTVGRVVRWRSHRHLPPEKRNVIVFQYAIVRKGDKEGPDHHMMRVADSKRSQVDGIMNMIDEEAIDMSDSAESVPHDRNDFQGTFFMRQVRNSFQKLMDFLPQGQFAPLEQWAAAIDLPRRESEDVIRYIVNNDVLVRSSSYRGACVFKRVGDKIGLISSCGGEARTHHTISEVRAA